ncbi:Tol-Pal system beta propeller repeat protein TolB [Silanimonas sp.]|uniref:Tol-Pal system beta propeller repeat protein TolB n=1 Tax=Silanimonas sp. TaxID=1929290 RepID=UPI001BC133CD|nr:Tol-Pal system beta propeller repeat protein TolB [Silanimonas sp.]MBS3895302.1 Tol-Pal system beta propeller repeat protein TolB [Silanimonas sp.]MBS3923714.1 Tol-Pal system beta propeller repeat protein TolB [Xanthomonadaceae bacterium]
MLRHLATSALLALALLLPLPSQAQALEIDIVGGNAAALPITVVPMPYLGTQVAPDVDVAAIIAANLNRSGQFRTLPLANLVERPVRGTDIQFPTWRVLRQDFIVVGRVLDAPDGGFRVEYELFDVAKQERLLGLAMTGRARGLRDVAHQISDQIYERILGVRGAFWTRIAYVTATGRGDDMQFALMVADADGANPQTVVRSREPLLSPAWSPDGRRLAYVSFERGNSTIYIQELATGARELIASFRGINGAPSFSPDGTRLAMTLSRSGNPDIYVMDLATRALTPVTRHFGIDTEAVWTPDGQSLIFTSDRAGRPQLYQVPVSGGEPVRLTFEGDHNAKASVSFDGKKIAMAQGRRNVYRIAVLDRSRATPVWQTLSPGNLDESPSFAPNASMLLYATKEGGRGVLYAVSADARVRQRLVLTDGDVREPAWSPFRQR